LPEALPAFAAWASTARDFGSVARDRAIDAIIDTVGCMLAGAGDPVVADLRMAFAREIGATGAAPVVGGRRCHESRAALINGTAAHALDFDDNFRPGRAHASAVLVPALLAVAAQRNVSGGALVDAYIVGLEALAFVGRGVNNAHNVAGWHPTGTVAAIGAAAGVGRLMGLDAEALAGAMANAVSSAAGTKAQFGTAMKPVHAGLAARNAVEAAQLAAAGIRGNPAILDHPFGFRALYGGSGGRGWNEATIGSPLAIESDGLVPKLYPCCGSTHYALDMVFDLKRRHGFAAADVAALQVAVGPANHASLPYGEPADAMQARFSMPYCLALALLQDHIGLEDFTDAAVMRPEVKRLVPLTTMTIIDAAAPSGLPHRLVLTLKSGAVLRSERHEVRGSILEPLTAAEKERKFSSCLHWAGISSAAAAALYADLRGLDRLDETSPILARIFA
jgi:2-methylcitrate dehydratase PrpD